MKTHRPSLRHAIALSLAAAIVPAQADWTTMLSPRDINADGVIDAWHDAASNLTWLADWGLATGSSWHDADAWVQSLDLHGIGGWRLPVSQPDASCSSQAGSPVQGYGGGCRENELGRLWHGVLGNAPGGAGAGGPFAGFQGAFWGSTLQSPIGTSMGPPENWAWLFDTATGWQFSRRKEDALHAVVAVRDGDVPGAVPLPTLPPPAPSQTHVVTFTGAGGDLRYGTGDTTSVTMVTGLLPLFDTALGTLERVDLTLRGWRSIDFTCTTGSAGTPGGCNARAGGTWILDSVNYPQWSFATLATLLTEAPGASSVAPPSGTSLSARSFAENSTALSFTDPELLRKHFSNATGSSPQVDFRLRFAAGDGGSIGQGGASAISSLLWDGDAVVVMTYHYVSAVPEPASWASLAAGLGVLGWLRRRRPVSAMPCAARAG